MDRAQPELQRRREAQRFGPRLMSDVERRTAPLAAAAAAVALVSTLAMMWFGLGVDPVEAQTPTLAEAIAPAAYSAWMVSGERPGVSALILELDEEELP